MKYEIGFSEHLGYFIITLFYILFISVSFDNDYFVIMRENEWRFSILYFLWMLGILNIIISYFYTFPFI